MTSSQGGTIALAAIARHPITGAIGMMATSAAFLFGCSDGYSLQFSQAVAADGSSGTAGSAAPVKAICNPVQGGATIDSRWSCVALCPTQARTTRP
jgi:hypothetical protein